MTLRGAQAQAHRRAIGLTLAGLLTFAWGLFWPIMKLALHELPIFSFRTLSAWAGALGLALLARIFGESFAVPRRQRSVLVVASLFNVTGWFYFSALGVMLMPAGRASLLAYTMPLWSFLLGLVLLNERVTPARLFGLALGLAGIALLAGDDLWRLGESPRGTLAMLAAAFCYAAGAVVQKRIVWRTPVLALAFWQLSIGGIPLFLLALPVDLAALRPISWTAALATAYIVLVGVIFGYYAWFRMIDLLPLRTFSMVLLLVPIVGLGASALILGEPFGWTEGAAAALIVGALVTTLPRGDAIARPPAGPSGPRFEPR